MDLIYSFDPNRFHLGTLCKYGHRWPGTELSLRRTYHGPAKAHACVGCTGRKSSNWLISFIDTETMGFPSGWRMGKVCKVGHKWNGLEMTIRDAQRKCQECERLRKREQASRRGRKTERRWDPELRGLEPKERRKQYKRKVRETFRKQGLTARGEAPANVNGGVARQVWPEMAAVQKAISAAGRRPTVACLVMDAQQQYWREHPDAKKEHDRQWHRESWWLRYQTDPELRLYIRQKSKRRKAMMRDSVAVQVEAKQLRARFAQFDHCCAYCGVSGEDLHIEHVVPISKGGPHALGNIIPACQRCNFSKRDHDAESWYRRQKFYSEVRWRKICRVLGWSKSAVGQLALL